MPLLLVISMIAAGCNNTDQKSTEAVTLVAEPLESESTSGQEPELTAPTESESSSGEQGNAVETPGGLVEVISIESGEPSLEPEDILPEGYVRRCCERYPSTGGGPSHPPLDGLCATSSRRLPYW